MDPEENQRQQLENAKAILKIVDSLPNCGEPTECQVNDLTTAAQRLAELVISLNDWNRRTR